MPDLKYLTSIPLQHAGDSYILGVHENNVYVEELYSADDWLAQHLISPDGTFVTSVDENHGAQVDFEALDLPPDVQRPANPEFSSVLDFRGPRLRGLRETDRISDTSLALSVQEKMHLLPLLGLEIPPMLILGIAERIVLSETAFSEHEVLLIQRIRVAYALTSTRMDVDGLPYDYDTMPLHVLFVSSPQRIDALDFTSASQSLGGVHLRRPVSSIIANGYLYVTESGVDGEGTNQELSRLHIWQVR